MLKITVDENLVSESMIIIQRTGCNPIRVVKKLICLHLFPMIENKNWILYASAILFLSLSFFSVIKNFMNITKFKEKDERL